MENNLNNLHPFYVGQKVVCINDLNQYNCSIIQFFNNVKKDEIYTVKGYNRIGGVLFKEFIQGFHFSGEEAGFRTDRFRVVKESVFPSLTMSKVLEKESQLISMN